MGEPFSSTKVQEYFTAVEDIFKTIRQHCSTAISQAGDRIAASLLQGGVIHILGTGHSNILAQEAFYRAGGLVQVAPIFDTGLMLHESALKSTYFERLSGYANVLLCDRQLLDTDVLIVASQSGRNAVPVEAAQIAKEKGVYVIGITSFAQSSHVTPRTNDGKRLLDVVDLAIDNHVPYGDATLTIHPSLPKVGPASTLAGTMILHSMLTAAVAKMVDQNVLPDVFVSANVENSDKNQQYFDEFFHQVAPRKPLRK